MPPSATEPLWTRWKAVRAKRRAMKAQPDEQQPRVLSVRGVSIQSISTAGGDKRGTRPSSEGEGPLTPINPPSTSSPTTSGESDRQAGVRTSGSAGRGGNTRPPCSPVGPLALSPEEETKARVSPALGPVRSV
ncbi:hypothetical protein EYF80_041980 [Liparis tanakae]|uniref:Uncharacterized protein n=1 Tax=Liparis tanakae TaxID=230148 RepID=A0A4Z2G2S6_9TELE|nr:hypothetical protein EYF80_041980 [Liparis tanakae]